MFTQEIKVKGQYIGGQIKKVMPVYGKVAEYQLMFQILGYTQYDEKTLRNIASELVLVADKLNELNSEDDKNAQVSK